MRGILRNFLCFILPVIFAVSATAGITRHNVLVVANSNSPASVAVANYYQVKRNIPASHMLMISCPTDERVTPAAFVSMRDQIKARLLSLGSAAASPATDPISAIMLCTGVPHIVSDGSECYSSADSALAACFTESTWGKEPFGIYGDYQPAPGFPNPYYGDYASTTNFEQFRSNAAASTSWEAFPSPGFTLVRMLDTDTALAVGGAGIIFRGTRSNGAWSWAPVPGRNRAFIGWKVSALSVLNSSHAYACTGNPSKPHGGGTIIATSDGGITWTKLRGASRGTAWKLADALIGVDFSDISHGWAIGTTQSYGQSVKPFMITTSNGGASWQDISSKLPTSFFPRSISAADASNIWICGASGGIYHSSDGGNTWSLTNTGAPTVDFTCIWVKQSNGAFRGWAAGKSGKIIRTEDGSNWTTEAAGLTSSNITDLSVYSQDCACASYGASSFLTYSGSSGWSVESTGLAPIVSAASPGGNNGVVVGGTRYIFADSGSGWSNVYTGTDTPWRLRYLVTRLDGYSDDNDGDGLPDDVKAIIDRACSPASSGKFILDDATQLDGGTAPILFQVAHDSLASLGAQVTWDQTSTFLTHQTDVMGYASWGLHDYYSNSYTTLGRPLNSWANGGIGVVLESTDGRSFHLPYYAWSLYKGGTLYTNMLGVEGWWSSSQYVGFRVALMSSTGTELASGLLVSGKVQIDLTSVNWPADHNAYIQAYFPAADPLHPSGPIEHARYPGWGSSTEVYDNQATGFSVTFSCARNMLSEMLREGASGGFANVDEPWSSYIADPTYVFPGYAMGYTFAESAYMGLPGIGWQEVAVGDPLMAPFAAAPTVSITAPATDGQIVSGTARISATATSNTSSGIAKVEFWLDDDTLLATDTTAPFYVDLDTISLSDGLHKVEAIAYDNNSVQSIGSITRAIISDNNGLIRAKVGDLFAQVDGTTVGLQGKIVSAAYNGLFYVEQSDRSRGIRVRSGVTVTDGNIVTVVGKLQTTDGEREIAADGVYVTTP